MSLGPASHSTIRSSDGRNIQSYTITDNPVFKVKIRSLANDLEQKNNIDQNTTEITFKIGDKIKGQPFNSKLICTGKIIKVEKQKNKITSIIILDSKSKKEIKIDPVTIQIINQNESKLILKYSELF